MENFIVKKNKCSYAIYYEVSAGDKGSMKLWIEHKHPKELFISNLFVAETNRKEGIGQALLDYSERAAAKLGIRRITLKVLRNSWMEDWYKRNGFIESENNFDILIKNLYKDLTYVPRYKHEKTCYS